MEAVDTSQTTATLAFEDSLGQLEEAVRALEAGALPLEDAIGLFERGMQLAKLCNDLLDRAELRVTQLQAAFGAGSD